MKRLGTIALAALLAGASSALETPAGGGLLLNLDATAPDPQLTLAGDAVLAWGPFALMKTNNLPPVLTSEFAGVPAVRFYDTGDSHLRSADNAPAAVTGGGAYTVEAWAYSTNLWALGELLSWGNDQGAGTHAASLCYGTDTDNQGGAARHSTDTTLNLGWDGLPGNAPAAGEWHHLAVTYTGSAPGQRVERLYADGVLVTGQSDLSLNIATGTRFHLGTLYRPAANGFIQRYNGAVARLRLHTGALTAAQVAANYNEEAPAFGRSALDPPLNAFIGAGAYADTVRWSQGTLPAPGQRALVAGDAAVVSAQTVPLDLHVAGSLSLAGPDAALTQTDGAALVGYGAGALSLSDGASLTFDTTNSRSLIVGLRRKGTLAVTDASVTATNGVFAVGYGTRGAGTADFIGATGRFASVHVGDLTASANGTLRLTNSVLSAAGNLYVGETATGRMTVEDSDVSVSGSFVPGHNANGKGVYEQRGGALDLLGIVAIGSGGSGSGISVGAISLTDTLVTCTNGIAFIVANSRGILAATNCVFNLTDFNVANPVGGARGTATVVRTSFTARDITVANRTNAVGRLVFEDCAVTSRTVYVARESTANGLLELSRTCVTSSTSWIVGELAGSRGAVLLDDSAAAAPSVYVGKNASATGSVTLADSTLDVPSVFIVGQSGVGVFSNLASVIRAHDFRVSGDANTAAGTFYNDAASRIETDDVLQVGRYGTGVFDNHGIIVIDGSSTRGLFIGNLAGSSGTFNQRAGSVFVRNMFVLGYSTGNGTGTFNQFDGDVTVISGVSVAGNGTGNAGTAGFINLHGGSFITSNAVFIGRGGTGTLHMAGGILSIPAANSLTVGAGAASHGTVLLAGGQIACGHVKRDNGSGFLFFDGGTLSPAGNQSDFIRNLTAAEVHEGGAVFDTRGFNATVAHPIAHDSREDAPAKDGGLAKLGAGTLTLTGALGFTGDLAVEAGILDLSSATYALPAGSGLRGGGTLVPPSGGLAVPSGAWVAPGPGTLTVDGNLTLDGELRADLSSTLAVTGTLLFAPGSELIIANPDAFTEGTHYTFATAAAFQGLPAADLPKPWVLKASNGVLRAVYNTGTLLTLQ
jgi:autotransporter-associated beta strand protein